MEEGNGSLGNQRCLFGRLGEKCIASGECSGDLTGKDRQRKVPGADGSKGAAPMEGKLVEFTSRAVELGGLSEIMTTTSSIVAAEIDGLSDLSQGIRNHFSRLPDCQPYQCLMLLLHEVCRLLEHSCAFFGCSLRPLRKGSLGAIDRCCHLFT